MARDVRSFLIREWPLLAAALAVASLALLPRFVRGADRIDRTERETLADLTGRVDLDPGAVESAVRAFVAGHPASPRLPEARLLLARAVLLKADRGVFPGTAALSEAWDALPDPVRRREIVRLLDEHDYLREATDRARELTLPEARLDLARVLAKRAAREPASREALLSEAAGLVSGYLAGSENRLAGLMALASVHERAGEIERMLEPLDRALSIAAQAEDRCRIHRERAKAFTRLGRDDEAREALDEAGRLVVGTEAQDRTILLMAILDQRRGKDASRSECARLIRSNSAFAPVARVVLGLAQLSAPASGDDAISTLATGLAAIRHPSIFEEAGLDLEESYRQIRRSLKGEPRLWAPVYRELARLAPNSREILFDDALLYRNAEPRTAAGLLRAAAATLSDPADRGLALRQAAGVFWDHELYVEAAALSREYYELDPAANLEGLVLQAQALMHAGCYRSSRAGEADALSVGDEFLARVKPPDRRIPAVLLDRGRMLVALGERDRAIDVFTRILGGDLGVGPLDPYWPDALLERGKALWDLAATRPEKDLASRARKDLREYLARYSGTLDPREKAIEAALLLTRAAIEDRSWAEARELLAKVASLADGEGSVRQQAASLRGDLFFGEGQWREAAAAYDEAYRADLASEDRLWGLLGRARANLRLGRKDEARRDYENGKAIYDDQRQAYERSMANHGKDVWGPAIEALGRELTP